MPLLNRSQYAKHRKEKGLPGSSAPAVTYAIQQGRITITPDNLIDADLADQQWAENTNPAFQAQGLRTWAMRKEKMKAAKEKPPPEPQVDAPNTNDFAKSRAAREFYESELARLKFEEKQKQLISNNVVRRVMYEASKVVRAGHESIVTQLAPDLAAEDSIEKVERILKAALDALDNALAQRIDNLDAVLGTEEEDGSPMEMVH